MTYDFSRLDQRHFEEMIQSLATARFNSFTNGVFTPQVFEPDGQRDVLIKTPYNMELCKNVPLHGRTIINCKCKEPNSYNKNNKRWLIKTLKAELEEYSKKEREYLPETLVFCVNIPLTAAKDVGLYDNAQALIQEKRKEFEERLKPISNIHILGANEISNMLALYPGVARRFGFFNGPIVLRNISDADNYITPSTVNTNNKHTVSDLLHSTVSGTRAAFVVGAHGFGKTTYMLELLKTERDNRGSRFNYIVWANYENDIEKSIRASLSEYNKDAAQTIKFDDINNEESLVFIDGANASIVGELNSSKYNFYSIVSLCSSKDATIRLGWDIPLAEKIFCEELKDYNPIADTKLLTSIIGMTNGHPMVASLLGKQAYKHLISNETLTDFHNRLKKEGFKLQNSSDIESVATQIATRYSDDYNRLDAGKKNILKCFCLLDEHRISPKKIGWHADNPELFDELRKDGFLECDVSGTYQEYYMHAILRAAVQQLCGKINYDDIRDFVKAIGEYIDRDNLDGADIMFFYHEVMAAFALFSKMSGSEFYNKPQIESFECQPEYAWMACNIFSAFDDYKNDLAYVGSKYAAKLCELSHEKHAFSAYRLAISYNAVGHLPSAYNGNEYDILKQMQLITENFDYLNKAKEVIEKLKSEGETHDVFEAKLISNFGAFWQRLIRLLIMADFEPIKYKKIMSDITSKERESYEKAAGIRSRLYECASDEEDKREYKKAIARSKYQIATCYFYEKDYDAAIKKHNEAINGFEELHSDTFKLSDLLFTSYSRLADTEYRKAQKDCSYKDLNYAIGHFSKAYEYLGELEESRQNKERSYYESFLKACIDMRNQNANYPFKLNKKSETINGEAETINGEAVIEKLRNRIHQALDLPSMSSSEVDAEKAKLRGYIGKAKGYYKNTDEE